MTLTRQLSRVAKLLVDAEGICFPEAESRLRAMTLEIRIGQQAANPAGHAAALTALAVSRRTFLGGVRVTGDLAQPLQSPLSSRPSLADAIADIGTGSFEGPPAMSIGIGTYASPETMVAWWDSWRCGVRLGDGAASGVSNNPLAGVAAGAHAVGAAFQRLRGGYALPADIDLWPGTEAPPDFAEVFLPSAVWLMGLGNLGQAFLWSLSALRYSDDADRSLILQDFDRVSEENWGTSILVPDDRFGELKTKMAESWAEARGFKVRRVDRALRADLQVAEDEPRLAFSGLDKVAPRRLLAGVGFEAIIDVGLGRTATDFDRYRVSVFDRSRMIDTHFAGLTDAVANPDVLDLPAYAELQAQIGRCGAAEISNASVAVPYVSAVAAAVAISRAIAICSGVPCSPGETQRLSAVKRRAAAEPNRFETPGVGHAGQPIS
ncbi:hypothetical protein EN979_30800 [Mesorhizobium sp. M7A.F.Ca.US.001.04.2.1]|uniref:hypothetical protein n=2 Tax=unclassified Mesorhizobium TaxID=325217 RepID=UPI000FCB8448|nr:hypothetical protein [Mesorhizobium sp. M7A.F.Ca.US.001.04.2.1]RUY22837.1 hypothetical protein EN979_30800 [Mesorhizobium sp. M7A.F.Ca.US.001.04.2.1]